MALLTKFFPEEITYTGHELSPHWIAKRTGEFRSSIIAFHGPCTVATSEMVDMEDSFQGSHIRAQRMAHFLGEWFEGDLALAVARQRLFIAGFGELLRERISPELPLERKGNDLFVGKGENAKKLSVSIVTATPVSTLFHFGVNLDAAGAPVRAVGLKELGVDAPEITQAALTLWQREWDGMDKARCKVSPR
jgi:hypothetical protein